MLDYKQMENCLYSVVGIPYYIDYIADPNYQDEAPRIIWNKDIPLCQLMYISDSAIGVVYHGNDSQKVHEEIYSTDFELKFQEGKAYTMRLGTERTWEIDGSYYCMYMNIN